MKDSKEVLQRTSVREKAYLLLRDWIVQGKLKPNEKLQDKELAKELGVSRTPIREALLQLEKEGLIQTKPNSATVVSPLDFNHASNLYSIVWTLEGLALRQAFASITEHQIKRMVKANEKFLCALNSNNSLQAVTFDHEFHSIYIQLANNNDLCQMLAIAKQKINRLKLYYFETIQDKSNSYKEHLSIIEALKQKDLALAINAIESNWRSSCLRILSGAI